MAYQISHQGIIDNNLSVVLYDLACYDTIDDGDFYYDRDELLHNRSAFEFVREQLNDAQRAELDKVDNYWKEHPIAFNEAFSAFHNARHRVNKDGDLGTWVRDENGKVPTIPRSHWWWWPLPVPKGFVDPPYYLDPIFDYDEDEEDDDEDDSKDKT